MGDIGLEPTASSLWRKHSTTELITHIYYDVYAPDGNRFHVEIISLWNENINPQNPFSKKKRGIIISPCFNGHTLFSGDQYAQIDQNQCGGGTGDEYKGIPQAKMIPDPPEDGENNDHK